MPQWNTPKLTQGTVVATLVAATCAALTWLAQVPVPERPAGGPDLPAPPVIVTPALDVPPAPPPLLGDTTDTAAHGPGSADAEPPGPAPPTRSAPWRVIDPDVYSLTLETVSLYAHLPGAYDWPLPDIDRLELICFHAPDGPAHLSVMQATDGRLYHWDEERGFLQAHLDAGRIDSREIRSVADPGAFMEPLRAAAHAACERSLRRADTPDGPA